MKAILCFGTSFVLLSGVASAHDTRPESAPSAGLKALVYSNTGYYRHPGVTSSIPNSGTSSAR
jgi:hypothetical protein